jgi:hypothetical protein
MPKWCQVRVFLLTCLGVVVGNVLAKLFHVAPAYGVLPAVGVGWVSGNALNAWIAARNEAACQPLGSPARRA